MSLGISIAWRVSSAVPKLYCYVKRVTTTAGMQTCFVIGRRKSLYHYVVVVHVMKDLYRLDGLLPANRVRVNVPRNHEPRPALMRGRSAKP